MNRSLIGLAVKSPIYQTASACQHRFVRIDLRSCPARKMTNLSQWQSP